MNLKFYIAKLISKLQLPSLRNCDIDKTSKVYEKAALTNVKIGRHSYVGKSTIITDAKIGNFCSIAGNCEIGGGGHPLDMVSSSPCFLEGKSSSGHNFAHIPFKTSKTIEIGSDVWIGSNCYIKAGVKIGTGAVIGAHAVVTKDVEPYSVVAGVPAKLLYKRFDDATIKELLESKWWTLSDSEIAKNSQYFDSPQNLLKNLK